MLKHMFSSFLDGETILDHHSSSFFHNFWMIFNFFTIFGWFSIFWMIKSQFFSILSRASRHFGCRRSSAPFTPRFCRSRRPRTTPQRGCCGRRRWSSWRPWHGEVGFPYDKIVILWLRNPAPVDGSSHDLIGNPKEKWWLHGVISDGKFMVFEVGFPTRISMNFMWFSGDFMGTWWKYPQYWRQIGGIFTIFQRESVGKHAEISYQGSVGQHLSVGKIHIWHQYPCRILPGSVVEMDLGQT